ncbi:MAG TPA: type 4a pilus biogenesis protein PilO [Methylomirabilota bacterium]|jgi:type IV pilus assembly protein PilO|nr:type 4a pilus biogenesis protein PilO [Methylomirabilota bacterium]
MALPAFFNPIVNAPTPQKLVAGVMGLLILVGVAYVALLQPQITVVDQLRPELATLQREVAQNRTILADLMKFRREVAELEARLSTLKDRLPSEREMPTLYRTLSDAAAASGLGMSLFQPRPVTTHEVYTEIPISVTGEAGYHQVGEFLEKVARFPRVVTVTEMKMTTGPRARVPVKTDLVLATYMYRPIGAPPPPKPAGAK